MDAKLLIAELALPGPSRFKDGLGQARRLREDPIAPLGQREARRLPSEQGARVSTARACLNSARRRGVKPLVRPPIHLGRHSFKDNTPAGLAWAVQ